MAELSLTSNFANPDEAYVALVDAHRGLAPDESASLNAKLVLILANHIGDVAVLRAAIELAKRARSGSGERDG